MKRIVYTYVDENVGNVPHLSSGNVTIVFRFVGENGMLSHIISEDEMMELGLSEATLYEVAKKNLEEIIPDMTLSKTKYGGYECSAPEQVAAALRPQYLRNFAHKCGVAMLYCTLYKGVLRVFSNFADYSWYADERNCTRMVFKLGVGLQAA